MKSLPSRERGLKLSQHSDNPVSQYVAPLAGAWIEIDDLARQIFNLWVAPLAGAWIEIFRLVVTVVSVCRSPRGSVD